MLFLNWLRVAFFCHKILLAVLDKTLKFQPPFHHATHFLWSTSFQSHFETNHFFSIIFLAAFLLALSFKAFEVPQYFL